jgi:cytochrome c553
MNLQSLMRTAAMVAVFATSTMAYAQDKTAQVSAHDLKAKTDYCKTCHGVDAQGFRGTYPMPRLAGQQPEYIENQLKAFTEHRRNNPVMFNVAHVLSPAMLAALTTEFKNLNPKPLGGATKANLAEGKKIYEDGVPSANVPPCASCHGPEAKGDGQFPRLASQLPDYVVRKLTNWDKERGQDKANPDSSTIMQPIAHELTETQIRAVAAYVSQLE